MRSGRAFPRVSGDLIFGLPGQTPEQARDEALELADLGLSHLSAYQLTIEPGTRFGELAKRGRLPLADEGAVAECFLAIDEALEARGLPHYEVSNYAEPGQEAAPQPRLLARRRVPGPRLRGLRLRPQGANGHAARGERWRNEPLPERYVAGEPAAVAVREELDAATMLRERIMLGLRTSEGVDIATAAKDLGIEQDGWTQERERAAARLEERGRIERDGAR